ncbi:MAG: efflux RND transporter periplasmic adaptor subunit, partial [Lachnospiraceae bacterium]
KITAPISGVIESSNVETHDVISQNDVLCVISGKEGKIIKFSVTERLKGALSEGDIVILEKDGVQFEGTIYEISNMTDSQTGLFSVKARLDETVDQDSLMIGSSVKLYMISEMAENAMTVPTNSVYYDGSLAYVYTYDKDAGVIHKVQVETGISNNDSTQIISGLDGSELVLTTWSSELYEGAAVRLKGQESNQPAE